MSIQTLINSTEIRLDGGSVGPAEILEHANARPDSAVQYKDSPQGAWHDLHRTLVLKPGLEFRTVRPFARPKVRLHPQVRARPVCRINTGTLEGFLAVLGKCADIQEACALSHVPVQTVLDHRLADEQFDGQVYLHERSVWEARGGQGDAPRRHYQGPRHQPLAGHGAQEFLDILQDCRGMLTHAYRRFGIHHSSVQKRRRLDPAFDDAVLAIQQKWNRL